MKKPFFPDKPWLPDPNTWKGTWRDDWRIGGQESYLKNKKLKHIKFSRSLVYEDYDQCEFCYDIFDDPNGNESNNLMAYYEPEKKVWICEQCYNDFKQYFNWTVEEDDK